MALVTGGGHGMGRAHCLELARRGARVGVNDVNPATASEVAEEVIEHGGQAVSLPGDVADQGCVEDLVGQLTSLWDGLDIVVSNAGTIHSGTSLGDTDPAEWRRSFAVHADGAFHVCKASLPWLKKSAHGRIIIVSSMWGQAGPGHSHGYCSAKGALMAFAKNLAKELGPDLICVNAIAPGGVHTGMTADMTSEELQADYAIVPVGRYAGASEIAYLVAFLASDQAAFITGQTIPINGGHLIAGF